MIVYEILTNTSCTHGKRPELVKLAAKRGNRPPGLPNVVEKGSEARDLLIDLKTIVEACWDRDQHKRWSSDKGMLILRAAFIFQNFHFLDICFRSTVLSK